MPDAAGQYGFFYERGDVVENIRQYMIQVTAAALLSGIVIQVIGEKSPSASVVRLITGAFMFLCIINPLTNFQLGDLTAYFDSLTVQTDQSVSQGQLAAFEEMSAIIKLKTETYIMDKAATFGANLQVVVTLDHGSIPTPCGVRISGSISPYAKTQLQNVIAQDLGIPLEAQTWTG